MSNFYIYKQEEIFHSIIIKSIPSHGVYLQVGANDTKAAPNYL